MPRPLRILLLLLIAVLGCRSAGAQQSAGLSEEARISLLTVLPGNDIHSLWGHSAFRVFDPATGLDRSYNYGTFDFEDDWFVAKFLYGNLQYRLAIHDFDQALEHYASVERRSVIEQALDLTPAQRDRLFRFLSINYRPENRFYTYDFLFDNCSTRIRDALEESLGSAVQFAEEPNPGATFRELIDPYQSTWPFLDAGIDWLLGSPVDRVARPYETMFLPVHLMEAFDHASLGSGGASRPLVASTDTLYWASDGDGADSRLPWENIFMWIILAGGVLATVSAAKKGRSVIPLLDGILFLVVGLAGVLIVFLWFISLHDVTADNWHLIWTWPTHMIAGAWFLIRRRAVPLWIQQYSLLASVTAFAAVLASPLLPQAFHPALYPIMLLVTVRGGWIVIASRRREPAAAS